MAQKLKFRPGAARHMARVRYERLAGPDEIAREAYKAIMEFLKAGEVPVVQALNAIEMCEDELRDDLAADGVIERRGGKRSTSGRRGRHEFDPLATCCPN